MVKRIGKGLLAVAAALVIAGNAQALQLVTPVEGEGSFINISKEELNLIQFPFSGLRAYTSSQSLEIKIRDRQVLVSVSDRSESKPQEVFFSTPYGTYLLMMVPKSIPAETIVMRIDRADQEEAQEWETENDYINRLKELTKAMYLGNPPAGFSVSIEKRDASMWEGIEQTLVMAMTGATLAGEVHELVNHGAVPVRIAESEFYDEGVLAVSLTSHDLGISNKERVYIVRRKGSSPHYPEKTMPSSLKPDIASFKPEIEVDEALIEKELEEQIKKHTYSHSPY